MEACNNTEILKSKERELDDQALVKVESNSKRMNEKSEEANHQKLMDQLAGMELTEKENEQIEVEVEEIENEPYDEQFDHIQPTAEENAEEENEEGIDITGLFPDDLMDYIECDEELLQVYESFFVDLNNNHFY